MNKVEEQLRMMPGIIDVHVPPHTYENMHAYHTHKLRVPYLMFSASFDMESSFLPFVSLVRKALGMGW